MTQPVPKKILFVDDEPAMTQLGKVVLERAGHRCLIATNGDEGLQKLLNEQPDAVVLDYMMPGISGAEMFRLLRTDPIYAGVRNTPVLMLTAKTDNDAERCELMELGLAAYLTKPFGHRELLNVIENALSISELRQRDHKLANEIKQTYVSAIQSLIDMLAKGDRYLRKHSESVQRLAIEVAQQYGMEKTEIETISLAALLHDIGKVRIEDQIINKTSALNIDEIDEIRKHVIYGVESLEKNSILCDVTMIVRCHHERIDGTGYPEGLSGDEIPLGARIISVVDAYDIMTSPQPYRDSMGHSEAINNLRANAGKQFDADVVEYFIESLEHSLPVSS